MKELSIMEKAIAYDEAVEKLRSLHDNYDTVSKLIDIKEELEHIFPAIKESEDERIRKELIEFFNNFKETGTWKSIKSIDAWIVWLENTQYAIDHAKREGFQLGYKAGIEKQGEITEPIEDFDTEFERQVSHLIASAINKEHEYNQGYIKWVAQSLIEYAKREFEKQSEQKPADKVDPYSLPVSDNSSLPTFDESIYHPCTEEVYEQKHATWSEEDELHIRELESLVKRVWATAEHENDKNTIHKMSDLSFFLKTLKPQLKQEWSEEDEEMFDAIIADIQFTLKAHNHEVNQVVYEREIDWFKALKDRYTWKPSDKQMKALGIAIRSGIQLGTWEEEALKELIEQLKKLKG